jgi:hypothetical protein
METMANRLFYTNIDNQVDDLPTKSLLKAYGNYAHAMVPIYDDSEQLIATLSLSWVFSDIPSHWVENEKFSTDFKTSLYDDANSLKSLLL